MTVMVKYVPNSMQIHAHILMHIPLRMKIRIYVLSQIINPTFTRLRFRWHLKTIGQRVMILFKIMRLIMGRTTKQTFEICSG